MISRKVLNTSQHLSGSSEHDNSLTPSKSSNANMPAPQTIPLRESVEASMKRYFAHLDGGDVSDLHE